MEYETYLTDLLKPSVSANKSFCQKDSVVGRWSNRNSEDELEHGFWKRRQQ